jgi:hypothetical protein
MLRRRLLRLWVFSEEDPPGLAAGRALYGQMQTVIFLSKRSRAKHNLESKNNRFVHKFNQENVSPIRVLNQVFICLKFPLVILAASVALAPEVIPPLEATVIL